MYKMFWIVAAQLNGLLSVTSDRWEQPPQYFIMDFAFCINLYARICTFVYLSPPPPPENGNVILYSSFCWVFVYLCICLPLEVDSPPAPLIMEVATLIHQMTPAGHITRAFLLIKIYKHINIGNFHYLPNNDTSWAHHQNILSDQRVPFTWYSLFVK